MPQDCSSLSDVDFLVMMEELRLLIGETEVERFNYFVQNSPDGLECKYAQKSLTLFRRREQRQKLEECLRRICSTLFP